MNLQVIASSGGDILWVSGALPGAVHDKKAEWVWGVPSELERTGLVTLADKGYQGSSCAKVPYRQAERQSCFRPHQPPGSTAYNVDGGVSQLTGSSYSNCETFICVRSSQKIHYREGSPV
jgi:hypothetical protein